MTQEKKVPVYILSGGKSSRFGKDKALNAFKGKPLILHVAQSLDPVAKSITVVADRADKYNHLGLPTICDRQPDQGPLGGLETALLHAETGWILCASCDRLGIQTSWLFSLLQAPKKGAHVVIYRGQLWQPFPALYHTSFKESIHFALRDGKRTLWKLLEDIPVVVLKQPWDWDKSIDINNPSVLDYINTLKP